LVGVGVVVGVVVGGLGVVVGGLGVVVGGLGVVVGGFGVVVGGFGVVVGGYRVVIDVIVAVVVSAEVIVAVRVAVPDRRRLLQNRNASEVCPTKASRPHFSTITLLETIPSEIALSKSYHQVSLRLASPVVVSPRSLAHLHLQQEPPQQEALPSSLDLSLN
jgi:hypothetical protein